ncbi:acyl-CoA dehydrogenase family protein [Sorangium sp. So ce327]|uniref:acyl-CoA dehydrogenase family protein n=1 Tax=Sorangium sp. So ce327 TaxID=3133301 RepID=UPI003F5E3A4B
MSELSLEGVLEKIETIRREVIAAETERVDREYRWPEASLRALLEAGLGGLVIGREVGGLGGGLFAMAKACEAIGEACASTALCFGMHLAASAVIAAKATRDHAQRYLAPIAAGRHLTTLALSEPGTGSHFYFPQTALTPDPGGGYVVAGKKSFVTSGGHADSYVVSTAAADPLAAPDEFSCVVVGAGAPNLRFGPEWKGIGMRGNASRPLDLDHVRVPRQDLLGEEGDQMWYAFHVVGPYFLVAMAATYLGVATAALREAITHVGERRYAHSGQGLAQSPVLQHRLGSLWAAVERTRRLVYHAAAAGDAAAPDALLSIFSAKAESGDCAVNVANEALTLLGGIGYREGGRPERLLRDARAVHVMAPTTDILRTWAGRVLLRQPLLRD